MRVAEEEVAAIRYEFSYFHKYVDYCRPAYVMTYFMHVLFYFYSI